MKENVNVFTKWAIFCFSIWRVFGSFFSHGKSKLLLLSCREYLSLGMFFFFFFWFFHLILNFFELLRKNSQNVDSFSRKSHFLHFFVKNLKNIRLGYKKKSVPRHVSLRDFPEIWAFLTQSSSC